MNFNINNELADIKNEIESCKAKGQIEQSEILKAIYSNRVYEGRLTTVEGAVEAATMWLGDPEVSKEYPSLMDLCDGNVTSAVKYIIMIMLMGTADGIERDIKFWAGETEKCFAKIVYGGEKFKNI